MAEKKMFLPPPTLEQLYNAVTTCLAARDGAADDLAVARGEWEESEADFETAIAALRTALQNQSGVDEAADAVATADVDRQAKLATFNARAAQLATARAALTAAIAALQQRLAEINN